jgi:hypothetical protein
MTRVEEARRPPFGRFQSLEARLRGRHREPSLLERRGDGLDTLGTPGAVERRVGALVRRDCGAVVAARFLAHAGHLDVDVERPDVLGEREQILLGGLLHLRQLDLAAPPPAKKHESDAARADADERRKQPARRPLVFVLAARRRTALGSRERVDEGEQRGLDALASVLAERLGRQPGNLSCGARAAGPEPVADDDGVRAVAAELSVEQIDHAPGVAAGLALRPCRKDRDVDWACPRVRDALAEAVRRVVADRALGPCVDVDGIAAQARDRPVHDGPGARVRGRNERDGGRDEKEAAHRRRTYPPP